MSGKNLQEYWKRNIRLLGMLLAVWFVASYGLWHPVRRRVEQHQPGRLQTRILVCSTGSYLCFHRTHFRIRPANESPG